MAGYTRPIPLDLDVDNVAFSESITDAEKNTVTSLSDPVRVTEEASTFAESDVKLTNNKTHISSNAINIQDRQSITRNADEGTYSLNNYARGMLINPNENMDYIDLKISSNTGNVQEVFVADTNENILYEDTSGHSSGDIVRLNYNFTSGTDYYVGVWDNGSSTDVGDYSVGASYFPLTNPAIDVISGVVGIHPNDAGGPQTQDSFFAFVEISPPDYTTANALIGRQTGVPADLKSWDIATFQANENGETVTVDIEDKNGNVLLSDISPNEDISSIPIDTDIQFRATLSRQDTSNNPTLDYLAWRFTR